MDDTQSNRPDNLGDTSDSGLILLKAKLLQAAIRHETVPERHRQLGYRPACEMRLSRVGGRDDDTRLPELCRLPLPG